MLEPVRHNASKHRVLVVLVPHPQIGRLFRAAKRRAELHNLDWEVVLVETPGLLRRLNSQERELMLQSLTTAEQMGAIVTRVVDNSIVAGIKKVVKERTEQGIAVDAIKLPQIKKKLFSPWEGNLVGKFRKQWGSDIVVLGMPLHYESSPYVFLSRLLRVNGIEMVMSLALVAAATGIIYLLEYLIPTVITSEHRNKAIIYMLACAIASLRFGTIAGLVAAVCSFLALSVFFLSPTNTLNITNPQDIANLTLFVTCALILSLFGGSALQNRHVLMKRGDQLLYMLLLHRLTHGAKDVASTVKLLNDELQALLKTNVIIFMPSSHDDRTLENSSLKDIDLGEADKKALEIAWLESKTTGVGAPFNPGCKWRFEPLVTTADEIGILAVRITNALSSDVELNRTLSGIADQVALIVERLQLGNIAEETRVHSEREQLRSMLLSSISHDLKTPLASIIGSLSVFRSMGMNLPEEHRLTLINTAIEEAQRLDSFITNILDMTRIESGGIELKEEWVNPELLVNEVAKRLKERLRLHKLIIIGGPAVEVNMDYIMTGQILQNLLDNAVKYTTAGTQIDVSWEADNAGFHLKIRDHGQGIPTDQLQRIFDKYTRIRQRDRQVAGTGLGLAIAKAVTEAQGGKIMVSNHADGGAVFTITLPKTRKTRPNREVA